MAMNKNWMEIDQYLKARADCMIVIGSYEQHGYHLPMSTDTIIPLALAERMVKETHTFLFPPLSVGLSDCHMRFPGTLTLEADTFFRFLSDVLASVHHHGFKQCLILNGHGGNTPVIHDIIVKITERFDCFEVQLYEWFHDPLIQSYMLDVWGELEYHGSAPETSLMLHIAPHLVRMETAKGHPIHPTCLTPDADQFQAWYPTGIAGIDPRLASRDDGQRMFDIALTSCRRLISKENKENLAPPSL